MMGIRRCAIALAVAMTAATTAGAQNRGRLAPRVWLVAGEGIAISTGGAAYRSTAAHLPRLGLGTRVTNVWGVEGAVELLRGIDNGTNLSDPRGTVPSYESVTVGLVKLEGTSRTPFNTVYTVGAGAYRLAGSDSGVVAGVTLGADGDAEVFRFGTMSGGAKIVYIPRVEGSHIMWITLTIGLRTHWLRR